MKVGDLVIVKEGHHSAGQTGIIVEILAGHANVYWHSGDTYWINKNLVEVRHANR